MKYSYLRNAVLALIALFAITAQSVPASAQSYSYQCQPHYSSGYYRPRYNPQYSYYGHAYNQSYGYHEPYYNSYNYYDYNGGYYQRPSNTARDTAIGAAIGVLGGALIGGRKGAIIGGAAGAGAGYLFNRSRRSRYYRYGY